MVATKRDIYRSFYTKSNPIVSCMVKSLAVEDGLKVLEPCAGDGVFIEALRNTNTKLFIDAYEISTQAYNVLNQKYSTQPNIKLFRQDALLSEDLNLYSGFGGVYDRVIGNPPYGAWQDYEKRKILKKLYDGLYVKETYGLFLYRSLQVLKPDGILVFIIPDTYLNLHRHTKLREYLLTNSKILEIKRFPSSFFPDISFGYANLSVLTLQKCSEKELCLRNEFSLSKHYKNVEELSETNNNHLILHYKQNEILENKDHAFFDNENNKVNFLINASAKYIGDIAHCVTGFYSGNDREFLYAQSKEIRGATKYKLANPDAICYEVSSLEGISSDKHLVPIMKGGNSKYFKPNLWFMDWSVGAVRYYRSNCKSRFQNPQFYFKQGVGVPMVSSTSVTAALIDNRLFDQSIVGVFPNESEMLFYLLAFFNSPTCNKLIRTINPSANNSANYIKKIPFIFPNDVVLQKVNHLVKKILSDLKETLSYNVTNEDEINFEIERLYKI